MLTSHRIPVDDLDDVARGRPSAAVVARITAVERTRRLLMFRAIAAAERDVDRGPVPLPPVVEAFDLLAEAERFSSDAVAAILAHPPVGVWAVRVLRRLRDDRSRDERLPLWHELGYAHALAGAAALRSGLTATVRVPASSGTVALPTVGQALFPATGDVYDVAVLDVGPAQAVLTLGSLHLSLPVGDGRLSTAEPPAHTEPTGALWRPAHRLAWNDDSPSAAPDMLLEDMDPYRDFRVPHPPPVLRTPEQSHRWQELLDGAAAILVRRHPHAARMVGLVLRTLVPLPAMPRFRLSSASYTEAVGSALVSLPGDGLDLAVTLIHEARHSLLNGLDHQVRLAEPPEPGQEGDLLYAPWRTDPRPLRGLLHGAYAFTGVAEFWRTERKALSGWTADLAHFEFAVLRGALVDVLATLSSRGGMTEWGRRFVDHLIDQTAHFAHDSVPDAPLALAHAELRDLRATWRIRHLVPEPSACRRLADRWLNGCAAEEVAAPHSALRDTTPPSSPEPRGELRRALLADGGTASADCPHPAVPGQGTAVLVADRLLTHGEHGHALRAYGEVLKEDPDLLAAWVGLGLALDATGQEEAARALLLRPEVVRAVALSSRTRTGLMPDLPQLSRWLGRTPGFFEPDRYG